MYYDDSITNDGFSINYFNGQIGFDIPSNNGIEIYVDYETVNKKY
ncbi:hypothetical protein [Ehrlichia ruminantium]|nr:hypothetical protein [Ehrlichia ruminantium]